MASYCKQKRNEDTVRYKNRRKFETEWIDVQIRDRSVFGSTRKNIEMERLTQDIAHACYVPGKTICLPRLLEYPVSYVQWVTKWILDAQEVTAMGARSHRPGKKASDDLAAHCEKCTRLAHINSRNVFYCCYCRHSTPNTRQGFGLVGQWDPRCTKKPKGEVIEDLHDG